MPSAQMILDMEVRLATADADLAEQELRSASRALLLSRALTLLDIANDHHLAVTVSFQTGVAALREEALEELKR